MGHLQLGPLLTRKLIAVSTYDHHLFSVCAMLDE